LEDYALIYKQYIDCITPKLFIEIANKADQNEDEDFEESRAAVILALALLTENNLEDYKTFLNICSKQPNRFSQKIRNFDIRSLKNPI
jgi:hypothetical protein